MAILVSADPFKPATKQAAKARVGLYGVSGSGKTMTALMIAKTLGEKVAVIDTEGGSASKYADLFAFNTVAMSKPFHPDRFAKGVDSAAKAGYDVIVVDGASAFWDGDGGVMSIVDAAKKRGGGWADGTPAHNRLVEAIVTCPIHIIVTIRAKAETIIETENGKTKIRKVGMKMVQRDGLDYEFDVMLYLDQDNSATVEKSRMAGILGDRVEADTNAEVPPIVEWAETFKAWLNEGEPPPGTMPSVATADVAGDDLPPILRDPQPTELVGEDGKPITF